MFQQPHDIHFTLPHWLETFAGSYRPSVVLGERMRFVIEASRKNVEEGTGGPFAAAVFDCGTGNLLSLGVNLVCTGRSSILHAEIVALALAQRKTGTYDLGGAGMPPYELATSTEPCAMCFGAIPWSGVRHLATAALDEDAGSIGFDEGPRPEDWIRELESRGIRVTTGVEREAARDVLRLYARNGGHIYNSREP
jgi:tRNA(Arg) A34 adenosine deaminase TadA